MTFTFDWQPKEHAQVVNLLQRELFQSGVWRLLKWFVLVVFGFGVVTVTVGLLTGAITTALQLAPWVVLIALWIAFFWQMTGRLQARAVRRNDPNVAHPFTYALDENGLHMSMKTTDLQLRWSGMAKVRETPELFLFYYNKRCAYFLPKRAIALPNDVER